MIKHRNEKKRKIETLKFFLKPFFLYLFSMFYAVGIHSECHRRRENWRLKLFPLIFIIVAGIVAVCSNGTKKKRYGTKTKSKFSFNWTFILRARISCSFNTFFSVVLLDFGSGYCWRWLVHAKLFLQRDIFVCLFIWDRELYPHFFSYLRARCPFLLNYWGVYLRTMMVVFFPSKMWG